MGWFSRRKVPAPPHVPPRGSITTRDGQDLDISFTLEMAQQHIELWDQRLVNSVEGGLALSLEAALWELQRRED